MVYAVLYWSIRHGMDFKIVLSDLPLFPQVQRKLQATQEQYAGNKVRPKSLFHCYTYCHLQFYVPLDDGANISL